MGGNSTDSRYGTRQTVTIMANCNITAATVMGSVKFFTNVLVREVRAIPVIPGTADASGFNIYKNTTSIGAVVSGTLAAGTSADASLTDTTLAITDVLYFKNIRSDASSVVNLLVDYSEDYLYTQ